MGSLVLLYFVFLSFFPDNMTMAFIEPLTEVYPSNQPIEQTQLVVGVSIAIATIGIAYFEIKSDSTCPVCRSPFALESKKQFFKPENRDIVTITQNGDSERKEVTYGVHILHCKVAVRGMSPPNAGSGALSHRDCSHPDRERSPSHAKECGSVYSDLDHPRIGKEDYSTD